MNDSSQLVHDLAIILITAGIVTVIFKLIKQPVILGYIVAGFLISPHFVIFPSITNTVDVNAWADIGVVFLLFSLGLDFSIKKLIDVGGTAFIGTSINMIGMVAIGHTLGQLLGWGNAQSIFLGCMLSISSTTIIIKSLSDMGFQNKRFANIVFGMLIVEDLGTILMMVLLPTIAISQNFQGTELLEKVLMLVFFIVVWFIGGTYIVPTLFNKFRKYLNDETLVVISIGLCLGMVLFATSAGFSSALGAFIMGSILSETLDSPRIDKLMAPVKNLFGAIFFVSVGMMIVPDIIVNNFLFIILFASVFIVCRFGLSLCGLIATGQNLKTAIQSGLCLTTMGEFSFVIAALGIKMGVLNKDIYPLIICSAVITMFISPYLMKSADPLYGKLEKIIPSKWTRLLNGYANNNAKTVNSQNIWRVVLKNTISTIIIYGTLSIAVFLLSRQFLFPLIKGALPDFWGSILAAAITLLLMAPFLNAIINRKAKDANVAKLWFDNYFNKGTLIALTLVRVLICFGLIILVLIPLFPKITGILILAAIVIVVIIALSKGFRNSRRRMEKRFFDNLNMHEIEQEAIDPISKQTKEALSNKNIHLQKITIPPNSRITGKTLAETNFKQNTGVSVITILRGDERINIPKGNEQLFPFDELVIAGTDEQIQNFTSIVDKIRIQNQNNKKSAKDPKIEITQYIIKDGSSLIGKNIKDSGIKEKADCAIIGIDRNEESLLNFSSDTILCKGDVLWLAGEKINLLALESKID